MKKQRIAGIVLALAFLCGCSFPGGGNVEDRLRPPRGGGEQEVLLETLDKYLPGNYPADVSPLGRAPRGDPL